MSEKELLEKKVKRKKSKPRFTSVRPEELNQFLHEVNEYKQILKSIGMYDLCQNWSNLLNIQQSNYFLRRRYTKMIFSIIIEYKRDFERNEQKIERQKQKMIKKEEKERLGSTLYSYKKKQDEFLKTINEGDSIDEKVNQTENNTHSLNSKDQQMLYENQQPIQDEIDLDNEDEEQQQISEQLSEQIQNQDNSKMNESIQSESILLQDEDDIQSSYKTEQIQNHELEVEDDQFITLGNSDEQSSQQSSQLFFQVPEVQNKNKKQKRNLKETNKQTKQKKIKKKK